METRATRANKNFQNDDSKTLKTQLKLAVFSRIATMRCEKFKVKFIASSDKICYNVLKSYNGKLLFKAELGFFMPTKK